MVLKVDLCTACAVLQCLPTEGCRGSELGAGESLAQGEFLMSDIYFAINMGETGDLEILEANGLAVIWSAGTSGQGNSLAIQGNKLVVVDGNGNVLWSSDSNDYGEPAARVAIQLNYNLSL